MERSLLSAKKCFVETLKDLKLLHEGAYYVLQEFYNYIDEYHKIPYDLFVYIQCDPAISFQRTNDRARQEENSISIEYLKEIHKRHEEIFIEKAELLPAKVLVIDGNLSREEMKAEYEKVVAAIFNKSKTTE
jgi:thymidylate kinase